MMKAPLRPGTRPVDAAQLAVEDTSTDGPEFVITVPVPVVSSGSARRGIDAHLCRAPSSNTICDSESRRSVYGARAPRPPYGTRGVRARLRAVGQAPRAGLVLEEVGVRHVERHSRLRPSDELAALHAPLDDGSRHPDIRHAAVR